MSADNYLTIERHKGKWAVMYGCASSGWKEPEAVFDTRDEANLSGNKALEIFENHFKLNPHWNRKKRFSNNGDCFGFPNDLVSPLAYLQVPFDFYAKITKLKYDDVEQTIINALEATERFIKFKTSLSD